MGPTAVSRLKDVSYNSGGYQEQLTKLASGVNAFYDAEGKLVKTVLGSDVTTYDYDAEGRRVRRTNSSGAMHFIYDASDQLMAEYGGTAGSSATQYLATDQLGSTRMVQDAQGNCVTRMDYAPFGAIVPRSGQDCYAAQWSSGQMFTGKERDAETGLDYFGARYMASAQGRFMSPDEPLAFADFSNPQSWNLYGYGFNSPLVFVDPDGHEPCVNGLNPENGNICTVVTGTVPLGGTGSREVKPDTKLDSPLFLAVASGINNSQRTVETAAIATGVVASLPILVPGTIAVIDGVAYTWEALLKLGPETLARLAAAGKLSAEVLQKLAIQSPVLANQVYLRLFAQSDNRTIPAGWLNNNNYFRIGEGFFSGVGQVFRVAIGSKHVPLPSWIPGVTNGTLHFNYRLNHWRL